MLNSRKRHAKKSKKTAERGFAGITVYVSSECVACNILLEYLDTRKTPYRARDIGHNADARLELAKLTGGELSVPVVRIGGRVLRNPKWADLVAALAPSPGEGESRRSGLFEIR